MLTPTFPSFEGPSCPLPLHHQDKIVMGHGSGGKMTQELIQNVFVPHFDNESLNQGNDSARLNLPPQANLAGRLAVSTDAHIVSPLFFPGGDIGRLAVCGTINDVSMSGAIPLYLTASFILEEGLSMETLIKVVNSMKTAAEEAHVQMIAGDTKVVEKGKADGLFISTTGVGWIPEGRTIGGEQAKPGDLVLISGSIGEHGIAVLAARGELGLETAVQSDTAPLNDMIQRVLEAAPHVHVLRDPTRGGLATTLNEIATQSNVSIWLDEKTIPVLPTVQSFCELLGFDPLYIANEGKVIIILPADEAEDALSVMRSHPYGSMATRIGMIQADSPGNVFLHTLIGGNRILDTLSGELLPRIC